MQQIKQDLTVLCSAAGVGGQIAIREKAAELLKPLVDSIETDAMGNVLGFRACKNASAPTIMLEAHLDEIGFLVTHIDDDGFVYTAAAGGIDRRVLAGQEVDVYGDAVYRGVFCSIPPHLAGKDNELPELGKWGIDIGMTGEEAKAHIPLGSRVTFAPHFAALNENIVYSKALDNRAGMAAILHCLRHVSSDCPVNIAVAFCSQEELGCRGAGPATHRIQPNEAIITDVSFALTQDANPNHCGKMGKGVMVGISPILDQAMTQKMLHLADTHSIPYQHEVCGGGTGTDADHITACLRGVPGSLLSIPQRYMHTPIEAVDLRDVAAVGNLMAVYLNEGGAVCE